MDESKIKSELLKKYWSLIGKTYIIAEEKFKSCQLSNSMNENDWIYQELYDALVEEWKRIYSKFVLEPLENEVCHLFYLIQTDGFEKVNNISQKIEKFTVYYYLMQYFHIYVVPSLKDEYEYKDNAKFKIETDDKNLLLYEIFGELWLHFFESEEFNDFQDIFSEVFYDLEELSLSLFIARCWDKTKEKTNTEVKAILAESTGVGDIYDIDNKKILTDKEYLEFINKS